MDGRFSSLLQKMDFLTLPDQRLLLRFSPDKEPLDLSDILFRLRIKDYRMLLLQPEIIPYYIAAPSWLKRLREKEVGFVIGLSSLAGLHGQDVQGSAENLLLDGMAEWTCSGIRTVSETDLIHEIDMPAKLAKRLQASPCRSF
jgi:protein-tyrosine phosphatase